MGEQTSHSCSERLQFRIRFGFFLLTVLIRCPSNKATGGYFWIQAVSEKGTTTCKLFILCKASYLDHNSRLGNASVKREKKKRTLLMKMFGPRKLTLRTQMVLSNWFKKITKITPILLPTLSKGA